MEKNVKKILFRGRLIVAGIRKLFSLYIEYSKTKISRGAEFRLDFLGGVLFGTLASFLTPLFQYLIYSNTSGYPGWTYPQILLFQSLLLIWYGISNILFGEIRYKVQSSVLMGNLDIYLLKPYHPLCLMFAEGFNYRSFGTLFAGLFLFSYCIVTQHLTLSIVLVLKILALFMAGLVFYISQIIFFICFAIRVIYILRIIEIMDRLFSVAYFPAEIFKGVAKLGYLVVFPMAIWAYYPAQAVLGRLGITVLFAIVVIIIIFFLSLMTWNRVIKKYTSAGG